MSEKSTLNAIWIMFIGLTNLGPSPPIWDELGTKFVRPWIQKTMVGQILIV